MYTDGVNKYFKYILNRNMFVNELLEEKKPMTRLKYADAIKIVYQGREDQDTAGIRRFRYR
jgi:hypothetical protein